MENAVVLNPQDWGQMGSLMKKYGDSNTMFWGKNEAGETLTVSISRESIVTATFLDGNRTRKNVYYRDGGSEEFYED